MLVNIRKDDTVLVLSGKYQGKKGKVLRALPAQSRVIVQSVNMQKKHQKPTKDMQQGGVIETEGPIHVSNVMLICPRCQKPTRVGFTVVGSNKVRVCKKCGEAIDK